jgi:hypothetical protein
MARVVKYWLSMCNGLHSIPSPAKTKTKIPENKGKKYMHVILCTYLYTSRTALERYRRNR